MAREMTPQERAAELAEQISGAHHQLAYPGATVRSLVFDALQQTRRAALLEVAQQVCMHCGKRAIGLQVGVTGPNVAGNYVHNPPEDSRVKESALCSATSIWSLIRYEDRLAQEG